MDNFLPSPQVDKEMIDKINRCKALLSEFDNAFFTNVGENVVDPRYMQILFSMGGPRILKLYAAVKEQEERDNTLTLEAYASELSDAAVKFFSDPVNRTRLAKCLLYFLEFYEFFAPQPLLKQYPACLAKTASTSSSPDGSQKSDAVSPPQ